MATPIEDAKATLLRALEQLENAKEELEGEPERCDLVVIYAIGRRGPDDWHDIAGWSSTPGPKWIHAALLRRAAEAQEEAIVAVDDEEEDDDE